MSIDSNSGACGQPSCYLVLGWVSGTCALVTCRKYPLRYLSGCLNFTYDRFSKRWKTCRNSYALRPGLHHGVICYAWHDDVDK